MLRKTLSLALLLSIPGVNLAMISSCTNTTQKDVKTLNNTLIQTYYVDSQLNNLEEKIYLSDCDRKTLKKQYNSLEEHKQQKRQDTEEDMKQALNKYIRKHGAHIIAQEDQYGRTPFATSICAGNFTVFDWIREHFKNNSISLPEHVRVSSEKKIPTLYFAGLQVAKHIDTDDDDRHLDRLSILHILQRDMPALPPQDVSQLKKIINQHKNDFFLTTRVQKCNEMFDTISQETEETE